MEGSVIYLPKGFQQRPLRMFRRGSSNDEGDRFEGHNLLTSDAACRCTETA